ncbi:MAG: M20/M25/M40 family metallo-hydrolase, partial [Terrimicrobiaceae bacterium]|nr:M20/M25/M40 family metallo-hydrolase [Terrimicrobiaceae bacterium]
LRGGTRVNVVPDKCEAELDIRTVPGFDSGALLAAFRQAWPDAKIEDILAQPLRTDASHPLIRHLESLGARRAVAPWFCDAAPFASRGMPAIALGPGSIAQAHTADEFISIEALEAGAAFFEKFLRSLPSAKAAV